MKTLALVAAVSAVLAASVAHAATPRGTGKPTVTLHYLEIQTSFAATIPQNQRPKFGDRFTFHSELYKWDGGKRSAHVGHADVTAVILSPNVFQITAVAFLPGGTPTVVGETGNQRVDTFPIVGGTGIYATARGEVIIRNLGRQNSNNSADTIRIWM